jgi:hypothetical protein
MQPVLAIDLQSARRMMAAGAVGDPRTVLPTIVIGKNRDIIIITTGQAPRTMSSFTSFEERTVKMWIGF